MWKIFFNVQMPFLIPVDIRSGWCPRRRYQNFSRHILEEAYQEGSLVGRKEVVQILLETTSLWCVQDSLTSHKSDLGPTGFNVVSKGHNTSWFPLYPPPLLESNPQIWVQEPGVIKEAFNNCSVLILIDQELYCSAFIKTC